MIALRSAGGDTQIMHARVEEGPAHIPHAVLLHGREIAFLIGISVFTNDNDDIDMPDMSR
jgi:hypothetical protein